MVTAFGMVMVRSAPQFRKQEFGMAGRLAGSVTLANLPQLLNAATPRLVTESGSTIAVRPECSNAALPTLIKAFGMAMVRSVVQ